MTTRPPPRPKPPSAVESFDEIGKRLEEIRKAEGRPNKRAPADFIPSLAAVELDWTDSLWAGL